MASYTTSTLLDVIKKRVFIPSNQETFSDTDLLDLATDEMRSIVVPAVLSAREEWYVVSEDLAIDATDYYVDIPSRAIAGSLREVTFLQSSAEYNLPRLSLEDRIYRNSQGPVSAFYIEGNRLNLLGNAAGELRVYYHCRPGKLVRTSEAGLIASTDTGANTVTVNSVPVGWAVGNTVDLVKGKPHFEHRQVNNEITGIAGNVITLATTIPTNLSQGDWIALEDESPVVQTPLEWFPYLSQAVSVQVLESLGDFEAMQRAERRRDMLHESAMKLITPRVEGEAKRIVATKNRESYISSIWKR